MQPCEPNDALPTQSKPTARFARVDGATELLILFRIVLSIAKPPLVVFAVVTIQGA